MSFIRGRTRWLVAGVTAVALACLAPSLVGAQTGSYSAAINGASEVPATTSTATGTFTATLNEAAQTLTWSLTVPSITNATMAHIHAGATGVNGGIVVTLFMPASPAGSVSVSGTAGPADLAGPLAGNWAGFVAALKSGGLYVNVHTSANPGGEIRGQLGSAGQGTPTATPSSTATGTPAATATPVRTATPVPSATAATVAPPKTGQAGLVAKSNNSNAAILLVVLSVAMVAGSRLMTNRHR
jgi:hypothetical protein